MNRKSNQGLALPPLMLGAESASAGDGAGPAAPPETPAPEAASPPTATEAVEALFEPEPLTLGPDDTAPTNRHLAFADAPEFAAGARRKAVRDKTLKVAGSRPPKSGAAERLRPLEEAADGDRPAPPVAERLPVWARYAYPVAAALALSWAGALIAFSDSYKNLYGGFDYTPFPVIVFVALAALPALFMLLCAYVLRQAAALSLQTTRAREMADELAIPAALAVDQAGGAADAVRREVARATEAGEAAERQLLSLRQALAEESGRLIAATEEAERTARVLTESLSRERTEFAALAAGLDGQVEAVNDAIGRQTRMVAETSDLAAAQLQEAEAVLAARATDLATAAGEAGEAAELAGEALSRQAERLESVGDLVGARLQALNDNLGRGHSRLADLAVQLQADQEALAARLETQRLTALATATEVQASVAATSDGAGAVAASLRDLIAEADDRLRSVSEAMQGEQAALDARARAALSLFHDAVVQERVALETDTQAALGQLAASAEETRRTAEANLEAAAAAAVAQAEAARVKVESLGEAAFALGQKADHAFDTRISAARRAIEQAAALVQEAGEGAVGRIDAGLDAARTALGEVEAMLASVDARIAAAPDQARAHAEAVKTAVEAGLNEIAATARKLAADTEAVDAALQDRVRRNYEMLSDALKTMGKVAAVTEQAAARGAPTAPLRPAVPAGARPTPAAEAFAERAIRVPPAAPSPEPILRHAALSASEVGLRPRLRLTPEGAPAPRPVAPPPVSPPERAPPVTHETLDAFLRPEPKAAPAAAAPEPARDTAWTWKDLLSSIDEPPIDDEVLAERLIAEIESLGLDAATLLPLAQIDSIALSMQRGDNDAVRQAVRGLAPGAVRRLSRRVLTDKVLRAQADRYVRRYEDLLNDSARRDREGFMTAALLGSEPGRAFLLFDAAVGELH